MANTFSRKYPISLLILFLPFLTGCSSLSRTTDTAPASVSAIYLVHGQGELDKRELKKHPKVVVVDSFDQVKQHATQKVAIWIDKNAEYDLTDADQRWLEEMPQTTYPIAVLGYDKRDSFTSVLGRCCMLGPPSPLSGSPAMFFTVIQGKEKTDADDPFDEIVFMEDYPYRPHVQDVLDITNGLLNGSIESGNAVPSSSYPS